MADERKGILTPDQEKILDDIIKFNGLLEAVDGPAISLIDNQGIERAKQALIAKWPEALPIVYEIIDMLFAGLGQLAVASKKNS